MAAQKRHRKALALAKVPKRLLRADLERRLPRSPGRFHNLMGRTFKRCTVIGFAGFLKGIPTWLCRCNCGNLFLARSLALEHRPHGCGCQNRGAQKHGGSFLPEYGSWRKLLTNHPERVCKRWRSFTKFRSDVGKKPKGDYVLGRRDRTKLFAPGNAGWMTRKEAHQGKGAKLYTHAGRSLSLREWADRIGISRERLRQRIAKCHRYGADISEALRTPAGQMMPCTKKHFGSNQHR
jgi:hypothetical protein